MRVIPYFFGATFLIVIGSALIFITERNHKTPEELAERERMYQVCIKVHEDCGVRMGSNYAYDICFHRSGCKYKDIQ